MVMEQRYVGRTGLRVSRLGLGTMTWGRDTDEHEAADQLRDLLDAGGCLVDVGTPYGEGACEEVLGKLMGSVAARDEIVICAKAAVPIYRTGPDVSRRSLLNALDASLTRLGVDHVDLWVLPGWSSRVPLDETLSAVETAVERGQARYAGIANVAGWQAALAATSGRGAARGSGAGGSAPAQGAPIAVQAEYSLLQRAVEDELVPAAEHLGLGVIAWSPLGRGVLTGKYRNGTPADSRAASPHLAAFVEPYLDRFSRRIVDAVITAADGLGCAPLEVALAWVRDRPGVSSVLVGARTAAQLRGSLASEQVELPREILTALDEVSIGAI
jgi:aryl-alcohol dehydrogenase-like predicted oxidoreductase